ncbi:hypothetical protein TNCV_4900841 [Trichonephila clavipes]|nr:hypothetical protein TNCV_4900841 [Trichonephila clavipes]
MILCKLDCDAWRCVIFSDESPFSRNANDQCRGSQATNLIQHLLSRGIWQLHKIVKKKMVRICLSEKPLAGFKHLDSENLENWLQNDACEHGFQNLTEEYVVTVMLNLIVMIVLMQKRFTNKIMPVVEVVPMCFCLRKPDEDVDTTLLFPNSVTQGVCRNTYDGHRFCALARLISHTHSENS